MKKNDCIKKIQTTALVVDVLRQTVTDFFLSYSFYSNNPFIEKTAYYLAAWGSLFYWQQGCITIISKGLPTLRFMIFLIQYRSTRRKYSYLKVRFEQGLSFLDSKGPNLFALGWPG